MQNGYVPGERRALVLSLLEKGKTVREIADTLGITTQVTYRHVHALQRRGLWKVSA